MTSRLFFLSALLVLITAQASPVLSLTYSWNKMPQNDHLVFRFEKHLPTLKVTRTGYNQLTIPLPKDFWKKENKALPTVFHTSKLLNRIDFLQDAIIISLKKRTVGFVFTPLETEKSFLVDIFHDPVGANWIPPAPQKQIEKKQEKSSKVKNSPVSPKTNNTKQPELSANKKQVVQEKPIKTSEKNEKQNNKDQENNTQKSKTPTKEEIQSSRNPKNENDSKSKEKQEISQKQKTPNAKEKTELSEQSVPNNVQEAKKSLKNQESFKIRGRIQDASAENPAVFDTNEQPSETLAKNSTKNPNRSEKKSTPPSQDKSDTKKQTNDKNQSPQEENKNQQTQNNKEKQDPDQQAKSSQPTKKKKKSGKPKKGDDLENLDPVEIPGTPEYNKKNFEDAQTAIYNGKTEQALEALNNLLISSNLPPKMQEDVYYMYADTLFEISIPDFAKSFQPIMKAYQKAINFNPRSKRIPHALLQMGHANLLVDNVPEATGYFGLLKKKYPRDAGVPTIDYLWGEYYAKKNEPQKATNYFQKVLLNYPEYKIAKPSTIGLARALNELNYNKQADEIMEYFKKRWPRAYISEPSLLMLAGIIAQKNNKLETARKLFSLYYNIYPDGSDADTVMARLGDIALLQNRKKVAKRLYEKTAEDFPDREGGLIAQMRLAEEGIFDAPSVQDMFTVFDRPYNLRPEKIYRKIIENYPKSPLAPVARLKLAMWLLWEDKYKESIEEVDTFLQTYPHSPLRQRTTLVGQKAFEQLVTEHAKEQRFVETASSWKKYPFLQNTKLTPEQKVALAHALWKTGDAQNALQLAQPFLQQKIEKDKASELILDLVLSIYTDSQNWEAITKLAPQITNWELPAQQQRQADYALALAYENLEENDKSEPLWQKLGSDTGLQDEQRAYALYFMAQNAYAKEDLANVALFGKEALDLLLTLSPPDEPKIKNSLDLLIRATERSGRKQDALSWALEYGKYVSPEMEEWPAFTYRLANLYKLNSDIENWKKKLNEIINLAPQSIYSQMATSDLKGFELNKDVQRFS